jgi:membrane-bound metal-dependent hydrolase YbcI (DUF457 family)
MDIATHVMTGAILASPMLPASPLAAGCFVVGSVMPDLDSLSRGFGKAAFMRWHQTYTHSLPVIAVLTALLWPLPGWLGIDEPWAIAALGGAMLLHVLMDATNTFGVALLAPLNRKRWCTEWVFLIDGPMIAVSAGCLAVVAVRLHRGQSPGMCIGAAYGTFVAVYWVLRWLIHRRAVRIAPIGTQSLIPSAFFPWRFFGCQTLGDIVHTFELNACDGATTAPHAWHTLDSRYETWLNQVPEYRLMRELSSGYRTVEAAESDGHTKIVCRDLRIRNFGGRFGRLEVTFTADGTVTEKQFYV